MRVYECLFLLSISRKLGAGFFIDPCFATYFVINLINMINVSRMSSKVRVSLFLLLFCVQIGHLLNLTLSVSFATLSPAINELGVTEEKSVAKDTLRIEMIKFKNEHT